MSQRGTIVGLGERRSVKTDLSPFMPSSATDAASAADISLLMLDHKRGLRRQGIGILLLPPPPTHTHTRASTHIRSSTHQTRGSLTVTQTLFALLTQGGFRSSTRTSALMRLRLVGNGDSNIAMRESCCVAST